MFYIIGFLIIIVFIIETCKSITLFDYYTEKMKNTKNPNTKNTNTKNTNTTITENFKSDYLEQIDDIKNITKYGFLPHNIGYGSNYQINPKKTSIQELQEKNDTGIYKYAPSYVNSMVYNDDYFNSIKDKYSKNRKELSRDWKCQRPWFDCAKDDDDYIDINNYPTF